MTDDAPGRARTLTVRRYLGLVLAYLLLLFAATLFSHDPTPGPPGFTDTTKVLKELVLRLAVPLLFVYGVVGALGLWKPVFEDDRPVRPWVRIVPVALVLTILACTNYGGLARTSVPFVGLLLLGTLMIGFAEEGLFRGLGVVAFRGSGHGELAVAVWTSLLFAVAHAASLLGGPLQVLSTLVAGFLYYLVRRASGGLVVPAVLHGLWNFGIFSAGVVPGEVYGLVPTFLLVQLALLLVVLVRVRRIEPEAAGQGSRTQR